MFYCEALLLKDLQLSRNQLWSFPASAHQLDKIWLGANKEEIQKKTKRWYKKRKQKQRANSKILSCISPLKMVQNIEDTQHHCHWNWDWHVLNFAFPASLLQNSYQSRVSVAILRKTSIWDLGLVLNIFRKVRNG